MPDDVTMQDERRTGSAGASAPVRLVTTSAADVYSEPRRASLIESITEIKSQGCERRRTVQSLSARNRVIHREISPPQ